MGVALHEESEPHLHLHLVYLQHQVDTLTQAVTGRAQQLHVSWATQKVYFVVQCVLITMNIISIESLQAHIPGWVPQNWNLLSLLSDWSAGVVMEENKVYDVSERPEPTTVKQLHRFLGFTKFCFIGDIALWRHHSQTSSRVSLRASPLHLKLKPCLWN